MSAILALSAAAVALALATVVALWALISRRRMRGSTGSLARSQGSTSGTLVLPLVCPKFHDTYPATGDKSSLTGSVWSQTAGWENDVCRLEAGAIEDFNPKDVPSTPVPLEELITIDWDIEETLEEQVVDTCSRECSNLDRTSLANKLPLQTMGAPALGRPSSPIANCPVYKITLELVPSIRGLIGLILDRQVKSSDESAIVVRRVIPGFSAWVSELICAGDEIVSIGGVSCDTCASVDDARSLFATANSAALETATTVDLVVRCKVNNEKISCMVASRARRRSSC